MRPARSGYRSATVRGREPGGRAGNAQRPRLGRLGGHRVDLLRTGDYSGDSTRGLRQSARTSAHRNAPSRPAHPALHGPRFTGPDPRGRPRPDTETGRRGPRVPRRHVGPPAPSGQRQRPARTGPARRTSPGQPALDPDRPALHRLRDVLPGADRVRPGPRTRRGRGPLPGRRSPPTSRLPDSHAGDDYYVALGSR